jgi:adenosylhomocysteine nucleosidase
VIAYMSAVEEEIKGIEKSIQIKRRETHRRWKFMIGRIQSTEILLILTGIGKSPSEGSFEYALSHYSVDTIIFLGFGGGLASDIKVGDLVICNKVLSEDDSYIALESDNNLFQSALKVHLDRPVSISTGNCLTVSKILTDPDQKQTLGKTYSAQVADMESYWIARLAQSKGIRFLAVRAISDGIHERIPPFDRWITQEGNWRIKESLAHFLGHPKDLTGLFHLYRNIIPARENLTDFFRSYSPILAKPASFA